MRGIGVEKRKVILVIGGPEKWRTFEMRLSMIVGIRKRTHLEEIYFMSGFIKTTV